MNQWILVSAVFACATVSASVGAETQYVRGASLAVGVNAANGRVVSIAATNGLEFAAQRAADLFSMELTRTDDFSAKERVGPAQAKRFRRETLPDGMRLVCSPTPQFKSINSSALSFLCSPTLTSIHDYWKNHSFD